MIKFIIPLNPKAQMRPRRSKNGFMYKDSKQEHEEEKILFYLLQHRPKEPLKGPIVVFIRCMIQRPKSHYGTGKNSDKLKPSAPVWVESTPDIDNYLKMIFDCLEGVFFLNDKQVVQVIAQKKYCNDPVPHWEIMIKQKGKK